ncbi:hypothetical protein [Nonomuraea guangzhouensis]|uniref:Secreted protein n=1 Tax=Nonomuraea guangzhouensis TaxID=1291555 RepID=A0ABW4GRZ5_9ACTN|nr:hypothetical protein [Nonomuraea guangzhouensis]
MITGSRGALPLVAALAVTAGVLALAAVVVRAHSASPVAAPDPGPALRWEPGACVRGSAERYDLTPCNGGDSEVVAVTADPPGPGACPDDVDDVLRIDGGRAACVRNFLDPHPGAPGGGGGVLRPGDCVALDGRERPCSESGWYGRAVALVRTPSKCPATTLDTLTFDHAAPGTLTGDAVICLGAGGKVLDRGMCVAEPGPGVVTRSAIDRVSCASKRAWARVDAFAESAESCPDGSERYLEARGAYRPVTCLRLVSK